VTQEEYATRLGYDNADEMNADHDRFHEALCRALGLSRSPTLAAVRTSEGLDHDWVRHEEAMVLSAQQFLNALKADR
jgi:hypothetical protein